MPPDDLEQLRSMIVNGGPEPLSFYPVQLVQLSTIGMVHNLSPIAQTKLIPAFDQEPEKHIPIFRFYFDGLIAHVHRYSSDSDTERFGHLFVGAENRLTITTVTFEESFQRANLGKVMETYGNWPEIIAKL